MSRTCALAKEAARPKWIPETVLLREIRERGYGGGISQLKAYR
jgi:hypothetical protein